MAVFPHGSARGGSRSDGPQQIKDLRADDFYGDSHDGNDGSRGSHDTMRNTRTYVPPTFAEATDVSEEIRERRADVGRSIALRVLAAVLIFSAIGIGLFPKVLQYQSAQKLASTSARSEQSVAGWPYPQADEAFAAAGAYKKRLAESGQPVIGEAEDPLAELYNNNQSDSSDGSGSSSTGAGATGDGNKDSASSKDAEYQRLLDTGDGVMGSIRIIAGYNLGYDDEKITEPATSGDIAGQNGLYTLLIFNDRPERKRLVPGICDEEFRRDMKVPMTKKEIRVAAISSLEIRSGAVVYDIGSGTGSIAVECAMLSPDIKVYAFECNEKAQKLLRENIERFGTANVYPVDGMAPEVLDTEGLEPPTNVFIGGSKGQLEAIVEKVWKLNPEAVIVISAVTLETLARITGLAEKSTDDGHNVRCEVVQMQVNQVRQAGSYHMMQGTNPVFLCVLKRV